MRTTRKERREYLKQLKKSNPKAYKEAKDSVKTIGKDLHRRTTAERLRRENG